MVGAVLAGGGGLAAGRRQARRAARRPAAALVPARGAARGRSARSRWSPRPTRELPGGRRTACWSGASPTSRGIRSPASSRRCGGAEGRAVIVLACDLPFVTADLVRALAAPTPAARRRSSRRRRTAGCSRSAPATSRGARRARGLRSRRAHGRAGAGARAGAARGRRRAAAQRQRRRGPRGGGGRAQPNVNA